MSKGKIVGIATLLILFIILATNTSSSQDSFQRGIYGIKDNYPISASTPIPSTYLNWFNGTGNSLNGFTSYFNTIFGSLTVNNSYTFPTFHNGTIPVPSIPGYNAYAVNVSIFNNETNATTERLSTTSPYPPFNPSDSDDVQSITAGASAMDGIAQNFNIPLLANLTEVQVYADVSVHGGDTGNVYFQIRNDSSNNLYPYSNVRYNLGLNGLPSWGSTQWQIV